MSSMKRQINDVVRGHIEEAIRSQISTSVNKLVYRKVNDPVILPIYDSLGVLNRQISFAAVTVYSKIDP